MQSQKRISLNTSLKNARIFEEHSDDDSETLTFDKLIKQEKERLKIKVEAGTENAKEVTFDLSMVKVKQEITEAGGACISSAVAELQLITPIKKEVEDEDISRMNLKSAKRSLLKQRNSPYAKETTSPYATRASTAGKRGTLFEQLEKTTRKLNENNGKNIETDPEVLKRRQKQIDFGKNTIGYDNYLKRIPRTERKSDDPMTPNKHRKYSRRGFDGLIKQWRLKLHKYDPVEEDAD